LQRLKILYEQDGAKKLCGRGTSSLEAFPLAQYADPPPYRAVSLEKPLMTIFSSTQRFCRGKPGSFIKCRGVTSQAPTRNDCLFNATKD